jgi:hypothetical protein
MNATEMLLTRIMPPPTLPVSVPQSRASQPTPHVPRGSDQRRRLQMGDGGHGAAPVDLLSSILRW